MPGRFDIKAMDGFDIKNISLAHLFLDPGQGQKLQLLGLHEQALALGLDLCHELLVFYAGQVYIHAEHAAS